MPSDFNLLGKHILEQIKSQVPQQEYNNIFKYRINEFQDHLLDFLGTPYYIEVLCACDV